MRDEARFQEAIRRFDELNSQDPNRVRSDDGATISKELLYAQRMTEQLARLEPSAPEAVRLAVRSQHLCRWRIPRTDYPEGREGYKRWRKDLAAMHAQLAGKVLADVGYDAETVRHVGDLLRKKRLKVDPDAQLLEDVACLVFLESYFGDFAKKHDPDKVVKIVRKTWAKMSDQGREAALSLPLSPPERDLVERALAEPS